MKRNSLVALFLIFVLSLVVGCMPTYVGDPETAKLDSQFLGIWHAQKDDNNQIWVVHKMNDHNYITQGYFIKPGTDGKPTIDANVTGRAWLKEIGGQTFVSIETYTTNLYTEPESASKSRYLVASVVMNSGEMSVKHVAPDFFKDKPFNTPAELEKIIVENLSNKELFLEELKFKKVDPKNPGDLADLINLIK